MEGREEVKRRGSRETRNRGTMDEQGRGGRSCLLKEAAIGKVRLSASCGETEKEFETWEEVVKY